VAGAVALAVLTFITTTATMAANIDALWDYGKPADSETRFRDAQKHETGDAALELETQIARTWSLRRDLVKANAILDGVEAKLTPRSTPALRVRYLLERGRCFNSGGDFARAKPLFIEAFDLAQKHGDVVLAIDAAHMIGFSKDADEALRWTERAMLLALSSELPRAVQWRASLANNLGSTERERGNLDAAGQHFDTALKAHLAHGNPARIRVAWWQVANVKRLQGALDEALAIQQRLEREMLAAGEPDEYVYEELAALYGALKRPDEAARYSEKLKGLRQKS